eukprot:CAMPEP_0194234856 /NCGR_PEP_ID=MMETSP0158-20130606/2480_1 /TAXON_ID=33649 /ORGANISM="Thalassionema nitzschioides, Strain L26-B" /LENGTH=797 /DNA_ID=CAMNT_0038968151 /DNA_START=98 /DNA_END=2491 /DNA_ORIENTATION=+
MAVLVSSTTTAPIIILIWFGYYYCANAFTITPYAAPVAHHASIIKNHNIRMATSSSSSSSSRNTPRLFAVVEDASSISASDSSSSSTWVVDNNGRLSKNTATTTQQQQQQEPIISNDDDDDNTKTTTDILEVSSKVLNDAEAILEVSKEAAEIAAASNSIPLISIARGEDETTTNNNADSTTKQQQQQTEETTTQTATNNNNSSSSLMTNNNNAPSIKQIVIFTFSAAGVFWCGPLLSLIDTSAVGLLSGTAQQAALTPATAVTDYAAMLMAFLYTGATNTVASSQGKDRGNPDKPKTTVAFTTVLQLSTYVGSALGLFLFVFARPLLQSLMGQKMSSSAGGFDPVVFTAALKYVRIRALGMPAAAIIGSAQASCVGMQDVKSPMYILLAAAVVNFVGDACLVGRSRYPWLGGTAGAAWATVLSQYAAVALFVRWLCYTTTTKSSNKKTAAQSTTTTTTTNYKNISKAILELTSDDNETKGKGRRAKFRQALKSLSKKSSSNRYSRSLASKMASVTKRFQTNDAPPIKQQQQQETSFSTRGMLAGKFRLSDLLQFPNSQAMLSKYTPFVLPVTMTQLGRVSSYIAMSHVVSSALGTVSMAAHQVLISLFWCVTPVSESLSLTAQSFIPSLYEKRRSDDKNSSSQQRAAALSQATKNFMISGVLLGFTMSIAALCIPCLAHCFTADPTVVALVVSLVPILFVFFNFSGLFCASEGLLLGQKRLNYVGRAYAVFFVAVPYCMLRVKRAALSSTNNNNNVSLTTVWQVFTLYQFVRCTTFVVGALLQQRKTNRAAGAAAK